MPARKSNASANGAEDGGAVKDGVSVEDLSLPKTMIQRLAKGVLPANTQIQKDALLALSKSATVFVNYLSSHAGENATRSNKKTIQPKDVFDAIHDLEFDAFLPRLEAELTKYNTVQCDKRNTYRRKVREEQIAAKAAAAKEALSGSSQPHEDDTLDASMTNEGDAPPAAKKLRRSSAHGGDAMAVDEDVDDGDLDQELDQDQDQEDEDEEDDHDEDEEDDDEEGYDDPNSQLVDREDLLEERENDGIGDEALDGDESD